MINKELAVHKDWYNEYNWDKCKLGNEQYGRYLSSYLRSQTHPLVLNINGGWGTGKTHFLRQLYTDLLNEHNYACVHINAWKSDFSNDPLLVIISELLEQLKSIHTGYSGVSDSLLTNLGTFAQKGWNFALDAGVAVAANQLDDFDSTAMSQLASNFKVGEQEPKIGKALTDNYKKQLKAIGDTQDALKSYSETLPEGKRKVFILVDELDRCRPTYAIEMLETIKHFFNIPNFVFVVATDTAQLSHSIKAVYGSKFDGMEYLSRFFNRSAQLSKPDLKPFISAVLHKYTIKDKELHEIIYQRSLVPHLLKGDDSDHDILAGAMADICSMYQLSLRKTEQIVAKFQSLIAFNTEQGCAEVFDYISLITLMAENEVPRYSIAYRERKQQNHFQNIQKAPEELTRKGVTQAKWPQYIYGAVKDRNVLTHHHFEISASFMHFREALENKIAHDALPGASIRSASSNLLDSMCQVGVSGNASQKTTHVKYKLKNLYTSIDYVLPENLWTKERYFQAVELAEKLS